MLKRERASPRVCVFITAAAQLYPIHSSEEFNLPSSFTGLMYVTELHITHYSI